MILAFLVWFGGAGWVLLKFLGLKCGLANRLAGEMFGLSFLMWEARIVRIWSLCSDRFDSCLCMGPGTTAAVIDEAPEKSFYYCLVLRSVYRFLGRTESRCFFTLG